MTHHARHNPKSNDGSSRRPAARRPGFSFTEVLFAVMILGVGFIMIAGVFPVSLSQVKVTNEESSAANVARGAAGYLQRLAETPGVGNNMFRVTIPVSERPPASAALMVRPRTVKGEVWTLFDGRMHPADPAAVPPTPAQRDLVWQAVSGNLISQTDPRAGWVAMYRRDATYFDPGTGVIEIPAPTAQIIIVPVQARNRSIFTKADDVDATPINLNARLTTVTLKPDDPALFPTTGNGLAAAEGAYVIISDHTSTVPENRGWMNGRVYKLGTAGATPGTYEMAPGGEFKLDPGFDTAFDPPSDTTPDDIKELVNVPALIVGRGYTGSTFEGGAMDVSIYTTYIKVN